jgi:hypothetical protein
MMRQSVATDSTLSINISSSNLHFQLFLLQNNTSSFSVIPNIHYPGRIGKQRFLPKDHISHTSHLQWHMSLNPL